MADEKKPILYQGKYPVPPDTKTAGPVMSLPGSIGGYAGPAVLALTPDALYIGSPSGESQILSFQSIRKVTPKTFPGVAIPLPIDGQVKPITPDDNAGLVIEYQLLGNMTYQIQIVTFFADNALMWVDKIQKAIMDFNTRLHTGTQPHDM